MSKPKISYTYTAPDGQTGTFQSTLEINFVAFVEFKPGEWSLVKKSKRHIPASGLGQSGDQSRYFASFPHVNVPVTVAEVKVSTYVQKRLNAAIFGKGPNFR